MKKNLIKKVFAVSLSIAMACSFLPTANPVTASAAAPYVSLKTTFKTLKVGAKYKMTLKNNTINWKIRKVETTNKPVATVYGKTTSQVMIKGKSEGRATIRVHVRTTERKRNNTKTLRCRVKVVPAEQQVVTPTQTEVTVTTQEELTAALANTNLAKLTIKPAGAVNFTIPQGTYSNVDLIVDAPQSDIDNSGTFKSIQIDNIKAETWTERGNGNTFNIRATKSSIIVAEGAVVSRITVSAAGAEANITVNKGTVNGITLSAKVKLNIAGTKADNAPKIPVTVESTAADSEITTDVPADVNTYAAVSLTFEKNAVGSTVQFAVANITATIANRTSQSIVVTRFNGTKVEVAANRTSSVSAGTGAATPTYPSTGGSTGGSGSSSSVARPVSLPQNAFTVNVTTGSAIDIPSSSALNIQIVKESVITSYLTTTGSSIQYKVDVMQNGVRVGGTNTSGSNPGLPMWRDTDNNPGTINPVITYTTSNAVVGEVTIRVSFQVWQENYSVPSYETTKTVTTTL